MNLEQLLSARRMVRRYQTRPVEDDKLERILQAGLRGPSAGHAQGVSWIVVSQPQRRAAIAQLAGEPDWVERGYPPWLSQAPVHLVLCLEPECYHGRYAEPDKARACSSQQWPVPYWFVDGGASLMLVLLAAVEEGLGAGFLGIHNLPGLADFLEVPETVTPAGLVTLGYALPQPRTASQRRPRRSGRVHRERW